MHRRYSLFHLGIWALLYLHSPFFLSYTHTAESGRYIVPIQAGINVPVGVDVTRYVPVLRLGAKSLYKLSFNYEFPDGAHVFLANLGEIPSKGSFAYLTTDETLIFTNKLGVILKQVDLQVNSPPEGGSSRLPAPEDFTPEFQSFTRIGFLTLEQCNNALNRFFQSGYWPYTKEKITYYMTTYQNIDKPPPNRVARVALQISTPYPVEGDSSRTAFRIQMVVQEQGIGSVKPSQYVSDQTMMQARELRRQVAEHLIRGEAVK